MLLLLNVKCQTIMVSTTPLLNRTQIFHNNEAINRTLDHNSNHLT